MSMGEAEQTIVVGGGQAGLSAGYALAQQGIPFVILDENTRTGDSWRRRWDSLRLFTPARYNGLPGMPFPGRAFDFPTKDEVAGYLEEYARRFQLPVRRGVTVEKLARAGGEYRVTTGAGGLRARRVIVATGAYQRPHVPSFARELDPAVVQLHSSAYCNPGQFPVQNVLVVGAGNSGAEIALELARAGKKVWLSGKAVGRIPADKLGRIFGGKPYWFVISRVLSVYTPIGRRMKSKIVHHGTPWIRVTRQEIDGAGIESVPRAAGVQDGALRLADGRALPVEGVVWATGFRPNFGWIELPIFDEYGYPRHQRGVVPEAPGLYFAGLPFQSALSSALLGGVGADSAFIVNHLARQPA